MCCNGSSDWKREEVPDHKFDFIDVQEYRARGWLTRAKYGFFWLMMVKSFAVYVADIYTAITLLAFGHFNGTNGNLYDLVQNDPDNNFRVPISYSKWIFTGCILFSFLLLAYEAHKSRAIIKSRDISYAYTNVMSNNYYSCRSYDHFCLFNQINNSKKKKDEFAFFIFFTFKGWKRLLVADGPRQVINFFTLYGLGSHAKWSTDPYDYYQGSWVTGLMILTMLFTVAVFAGSMILLIAAAVMYIPLLCYIKGNLKEYCCHKIDKRISEMVKRKKKQRLMKQAAIARKEAAGDFSHLMNKKGEMVGRAIPQPTLPNVDVDLMNEKPGIGLQRTNSGSSSTVAHSQLGFHGADKDGYGSPSMNASRFYGMGSNYSSTADLVKNAGHAGGEAMRGAPGLPPGSAASPAFGAAHVRGMETLLDQMGPVGTSPMLFAQRVGGQGRLSPQPGAQGQMYNHGPGQPRALVDPQAGLLRSPNLGAHHVGPSPLNPESQWPAQSQAVDGPYANGGLDYPPPKDSHGVEGLEFPPPAPSDLSSYVPYSNGADHNGASGAQDHSRLPSFAFETASSTLHDHGAQAGAYAVGEPPYQHQHQQQYYNSGHAASAGNSASPSPDPSTRGYEDLYDAYLTSQNPSQSVTPERRNSGYVGETAGGDWHAHGYASNGSPGQDAQAAWDQGGAHQVQNGYASSQHADQQYHDQHQQQQQHYDQQQHGQYQQQQQYSGHQDYDGRYHHHYDHHEQSAAQTQDRP
ncbi:uncharacterized protein PFL1_04261 [Pseudozyma flocculosa PF-1]|uniref:Vacuole protein n=2 Tax=Pseudozyma flocculosa TaxID=84751 RepID=A0A5C3ETK7_9BASI|nr:uncharacterized protein PFL1_04261 [Pseudozyma flocculosa PF-1]EPQ28435.1 hypothetical protein PFL1_04261 [Pseudozyma flocculosa PF-1]SPO35608.1 uncharacterized protein PSFLO_01079 [Pseudozyma flocculosa]